ncbi:hypothetical protein F511_20902 [Dorcoceras hygrometricum]|uniref:Uncharacterized protein n=1 Tax=Dorcoceras hygrometricum TaxID=472368 RepID=A0A2Z7APZ7_9LAMI|nr:hypothetical protein F511_20902 [Dorcoceras hygrometricum]
MKKAAGALSIDDVISSDITISRKLLFTSRCYLKLAIAKRCRSNKLVRQRFAFALRFSRWFDFSRQIQWNLPAAAVLKKTDFAINLLRSRCQNFSRAYSSLKAFKAQALEESSFI